MAAAALLSRCKKIHRRADKKRVDYGVWTFERGADRLEISRKHLDDGTALVIAGDGMPRSYFFREYDRLETFQKDMETLLLKTGWSFVSYEPDRRAGRDRRDFPADRTIAAAGGLTAIRSSRTRTAARRPVLIARRRAASPTSSPRNKSQLDIASHARRHTYV